MKKTILGFVVGVGLMFALFGEFGPRNDLFAQRVQPSSTPGGDLVVIPFTSDKGHLLAIVETKLHTMSIYRIDAATGKIALKSARNIHWDLQLTEFNNEAPLPQDIKALLEQR
jgi:hypothetical protein